MHAKEQVSRLSHQKLETVAIGDLNDAVIWLHYQNPYIFLFLKLIRAIVILTPLGFQHLKNGEKSKGTDGGRCSQMTTTCKSPIFAVAWDTRQSISDQLC